MRLIDADALKEKSYRTEFAIPVVDVEDIDNAPTVKTYCYFCGQKEHGIIKDRPHGKWRDESRDSLLCSNCGKRVYKPFIGGFPTERSQHYSPNFCAFCGAKMEDKE